MSDSSRADRSREKTRLDLLMVERGLAPTRKKAQALIMAGMVRADRRPATKPATPVSRDCPVEVKEPAKFVGRGGLKLERALAAFRISPREKKCLDIGASTGGFTDCLLQGGAKKVYAVDAGKGQLAWKLRQDPRVACMEKTNARYLTAADFSEKIDLCVMDVSFISVRKILPAVKSLMEEKGEFVVLLKPQFEAGPNQSKKGIVKDPKIHEEVLTSFLEWCPASGFIPLDATFSPVTGSDGNIEFLIRLGLMPAAGTSAGLDVLSLVCRAHESLGARA